MKSLVPSALAPPLNQSKPSASGEQRQPPGRNGGACFNCQQLGHWKNECPYSPKGRGPYQGQRTYQGDSQTEPKGASGGQQVHTNRAVTQGLKQATSAYVEVRIEGKPIQCLVDSGAETSIFPLDCIEPEWLRPTTNTLKAANGSEIPVNGEALVPITLPGFKCNVKAIISEHVPEPMLGYDWLRDVGALVDFGRRCLIVNNRRYRLYSRSFTGWIRRIVVQHDVQIPDRCEYDVSTKVEFSRFAQTTPEAASLWMTEADSIRDGVYLPRVLISEGPTEIPVRILNVLG